MSKYKHLYREDNRHADTQEQCLCSSDSTVMRAIGWGALDQCAHARLLQMLHVLLLVSSISNYWQ